MSDIVTVSIPYGYQMDIAIASQLLCYWTSSDGEMNWFDIPVCDMSDELLDFLIEVSNKEDDSTK